MEIRYPINYIKEKGICGSINLTILNITWAQFYGLENSVGCIAHWVTKSRTRLSDTHFISLVAQSVKSPHVMREIWVLSLGEEGPLEEGMTTQSSILS